MSYQSEEQPKLRDRLNIAVQHNQKMTGMSNDITELKSSIDKLNDRLNRLNEVCMSKSDRDDVIDLKASLGKLSQKISEVEEKSQSTITKEMFKNELDEISKCFEDFVINGTPRVDVNTFEKRLSDIESKLSSMQVQPRINIRTAEDTEQKSTLTTDNLQKNESFFRKPEKKK